MLVTVELLLRESSLVWTITSRILKMCLLGVCTLNIFILSLIYL